jgi:hypothetical protein
MTIKEKYDKYIGCQTYINPKNGYLTIVKNGKAIKLSNINNDATHGMCMGVMKYGRSYVILVTYNGANTFFYSPKHTKVI